MPQLFFSGPKDESGLYRKIATRSQRQSNKKERGLYFSSVFWEILEFYLTFSSHLLSR
jgi:hypothetical protein